MQRTTLYKGCCKQILPTLDAESVDSIVTDPPYEIGFMGQKWDASGIAYDIEVWREAYRVLRPGGYLLAFGGARTYHRLACAIEDAGFEIRDQIMWIYSQGFPKSLNLDGEHDGKGTALKPSHEPIVVARKPPIGTILQNVEQYGTGALNIDACRIPFENEQDLQAATWGRGTNVLGGNYVGAVHSNGKTNIEANPEGRWPANLIHDGSEEVLEAFSKFGKKTSGKPSGIKAGNNNNVFGQFAGGIPVSGYGDSGSVARFFYCAKATKADRDEGLQEFELKQAGVKNESGRGFSESDPYRKILRRNTHPTVKPTPLMQYLCRLVTPENGVVLDPFMGSGSTGKGAVNEGFRFIGIELMDEHFPTAQARINYAVKTYCRQLSVFQHLS